MKIVARNVIAIVKSKQAARKERLQRQAAADAFRLATAHDHHRSKR